MKRILTVQDISCLGKCSLTVALPVISAMGVETVILPTAVLSTHTMFQGFTVKDLSDQIGPITEHWKKEGVTFDAIYTGYLGTEEQIGQMEELFDAFRTVYVWSDEFLFEEVLVNYFNNALNHVNEDKIIRINVEKIDKVVRVTVYNSGDPIPEEELDQIWGKFYKIDKARTRAYGGSGIGLSIVKAVMEAHGQTCRAENYENGVAFCFTLPLSEKKEK